MEIGFLTACLGDMPLEEAVKWAAKSGFQRLEVPAPQPVGRRKKTGPVLDVSNMTRKSAEMAMRTFDQNGVKISCLATYTNNLDQDLTKRKARIAQLKKAIDAAALMGVDVVGTFVGRDARKTIEQNLAEFKKVFKPIADYAERRGVYVAIENCPMVGWQAEGLVGNIAYSPEVWERMFELVPSECMGLNLDPSHLYWLGCDIIETVKDFADRIHHVHAKDTEIIEEKLSSAGVLGNGWWRYRMPGLGEIEWGPFINALSEVGFDGTLSIEHEDPVWEGSEAKVKRGLVFARKHLVQFIV